MIALLNFLIIIFSCHPQYNAIDTSPVSKYITHPFWNFCVEVLTYIMKYFIILIVNEPFLQYCPRWLAPNVLTLSGFLLLVLQFSLFTYYDPYFYASDDTHPEYPPVPSWLWVLAANCMFWAHTLGNYRMLTERDHCNKIGLSFRWHRW